MAGDSSKTSVTHNHHLVNRWDWCFRTSVSWCNVAGASQCVSGFTDQGEGGEQGPHDRCCSLWGPALLAVQRQLGRDELIFAFLDDIHMKISPDRVAPICALLQQELWRHARIRVHDGQTQVWNRAGFQQDATCWTELLVLWTPTSPRFGEGRGSSFRTGHLSDTMSLSATICCAQSRSTQSC